MTLPSNDQSMQKKTASPPCILQHVQPMGLSFTGDLTLGNVHITSTEGFC